ncbi:aminoglycoside phosphotransferase [Paenibacillus montaniterrae]|uniref:Aminoglycoside phosphotransferase n=1 Tax=Paenibacillus montaniterrae TaxID=429341 RepID=A0A919YRW5_9BACL|nr:phosphotransferase [Paenibacillus montaniterrae]GIP18102.1 aminoglycoside phosphotransferase [Paenibacillus montaniterrae]
MKLENEMTRVLEQLQQKEILGSHIVDIKQLSGTTEGRVYSLVDQHNGQYILKFDRLDQIQLVQSFYETYKEIALFPKVLYVDHEQSFILYSYIRGTTHFNRGIKRAWLSTLISNLINHYELYQRADIWGRIDFPCESWHQFNAISIEEAKDNIQDTLPIEDFELVNSLVNKLFHDESTISKYLLHGDTGVHNFVFEQSSFAGVIDPSPIVGPLLYDFMYAFCSSPDDIDTDTLFAAYHLLHHKPVTDSRLIEEVAVQLYCRIGICLRHHKEDLPQYLKAWQYWKGLL